MPFFAVQIHKRVLQYVSHFYIPDLQKKRTLMPGKCIWLMPKPGAALQYMKFIVYIFFFLRQRTLMSKDRCYNYHGYWCWLHRRRVCLD